jgi:Flp pilus assembly pilin Flp
MASSIGRQIIMKRGAVVKVPGGLRKEKGQALIEYTILAGLLGLALVVATANVADQVMDIWNDLMEDMDAIDDGNANLDLVFPQSDADGDPDDGVDIGGGTEDNEDGGYRDEDAAHTPPGFNP